MSKLLKIIFLWSVILGVTAIGFNLVFGANSITYISKFNVAGITYYKLDIRQYINNIQTTFTDVTKLQLVLQSRTWNDDVINNLGYMFNWMITIANITLYPLRVSSFLGRTLLSIIGIDIMNTEGSMYWLVNITTFFSQLQIPYV